MVIKCPNCSGLPTQGTNYEKLLQLAEAEELKCLCGTCGHSWKPTPEEQKVIAANLQKLIAALPAE